MIVRRHKGGNGKAYKPSQDFKFATRLRLSTPDTPKERAAKDAMIAEFLAKHPEKRLHKDT